MVVALVCLQRSSFYIYPLIVCFGIPSCATHSLIRATAKMTYYIRTPVYNLSESIPSWIINSTHHSLESYVGHMFRSKWVATRRHPRIRNEQTQGTGMESIQERGKQSGTIVPGTSSMLRDCSGYQYLLIANSRSMFALVDIGQRHKTSIYRVSWLSYS